MTHRQIFEIPTDERLIIKLPKTFKGKKKVLVILDDSIDPQIEKLEQLKQAMKDPLFLADMEEIDKDFDSIDYETI